MDNKEGTVIGLGCLALCSLYYFYRQYSHQSQSIKQQRGVLRGHQHRQAQTLSMVNFSSVKENGSVTALFPCAQVRQIPPDAFNIFYRQVKRPHRPDLMDEAFIENQTGGRFTIQQNGQHITVDMKNCNISTQLLQQNKSPNFIFQENSRKNAIFNSYSYTLKSAKSLAVYGALKYSISENKFIIEPQFILDRLPSSQEAIQKICSFWDDKIYKITFKKIVICFGMVTLGYLLIYRPLKNIWLRLKVKKQKISEGELDYFKNRVSFRASIESALKCQNCKQNDISFVYECGHLVVCEECHRQSKDHKCNICGKKSKKFMKIFI